MMDDDQAALLLLEYLATRKCQPTRCLAVDDAATTKATRATSPHAYRECLLKVLKNAAGQAKDLFVEDAKTKEGDACPLRCVERILETLLLDSYRASVSERKETFGRNGGAYLLDDRHVLLAVQALGLQASSQEPGEIRPNGSSTVRAGTAPTVTASELRSWRALLVGHVARRVIAPEGRRTRWGKNRIRVSARAVALFRRVVVSLLDPSNVALYAANDGVQISFRSSCGGLRATFFQFYGDDDDDDDKHGTPETHGNQDVSGKWIGAVIDCPAAIEKATLGTLTKSDDDDDDSSIGSDPCCAEDNVSDDEESSSSDDDDEDEYGFSSKRGSDQEMSTASMTSSLSTTSSGSELAGPSTPLLASQKGRRRTSGEGFARATTTDGFAHPRSLFFVTLPALLLASGMARR